jgi:hypothetical protein
MADSTSSDLVSAIPLEASWDAVNDAFICCAGAGSSTM